MTAQILSSELSNLIQESRRKNTELRNAAEKSLEELKSLHSTSDDQLAADLRRRPNFVTPFLIACGSRNPKLIGIAVTCLQRLIVSNCLAKQKLNEVLIAFSDATTQGLDIQLKILQALPSLLQNYADELKGELLATALSICSTLQGSKVGVVNNTAAATLQQLVVSVFDKVVSEDAKAPESPTVGEISLPEGPIEVREAAMDAYKIFNDVCLLTEGRKPDGRLMQFLRFASVPQAFGLELIESVLTNHADIFLSHPEQAHVLSLRVMPFVIKSLSERLNFPTTVRIMRVLYILLRRHLDILTSQCEVALSLLIHMLDPDAAPLWKRTMCMEVFRGIYAEQGLVRKIYSYFDAQDGNKNIVRDHVAALVRLTTEKPAIIGLGQQSSMPRIPSNLNNPSDEQAAMEAGGVVGMIGGAVSMHDINVPGISLQWSSMRVPCMDHLDKADPPNIPESYIYSIVLTCIHSFSEGLAKFIMPLTVPAESKSRRRNRTVGSLEQDGTATSTVEVPQTLPLERRDSSARRSSRKSQVPVNPLTLEQHVLYADIKTCAAMIEACWPGILASCSSFLHAALDNEFYHGLVRSIQKFTQVSGLLRLSTPRDAFLTALGKAAVPSNVLSASVATSQSSNITESQGMFANAKVLLNVDTIVGQSSAIAPERNRQAPSEGSNPSLNMRNLLCLRALLYLGIALGPTLEQAWPIVLETLQQANFIIVASSRKLTRQASGPGLALESQVGNDSSSWQASLASEIRAVETATTRMFESTVDFPNQAFVDLVRAMCKLLNVSKFGSGNNDEVVSRTSATLSHRAALHSHRRIPSFSGISTVTASRIQEDNFVLEKLGELATINAARLTSYDPDVSGWNVLVNDLIAFTCSTEISAAMRLKSAEVLNRFAMAAASSTVTEPQEPRGGLQRRLLAALRAEVGLSGQDGPAEPVSSSGTDIEVHLQALETMRSILEQCGEALVAGWDMIFEIVSSAFTKKALQQDDSENTFGRGTTVKSPKLIRSSFGSLQLICSDFLPALPASCILILVDTLFKFCFQDVDLNISLTATTFFWNVSDFLQRQSGSKVLTKEAINAGGEKHLVALTRGADEADSHAALWLLLLLRLTTVTTDHRAEVRNGAAQTLLRIFDAYGDRLPPEAWRCCLEIVIFPMMEKNQARLMELDESPITSKDEEIKAWNETTIIILAGVAGIYADYLDGFVQQSNFLDSWQTLIRYFEYLLPRNWLNVNAAIFASLQRILSKIETANQIGKPSLDQAWAMWSKTVPIAERAESRTQPNNQDALVAYIGSFKEIYRLIKDDCGERRMIESLHLLHECVVKSDLPAYSTDVDTPTQLQTQVLESLRLLRTDIPGVGSALVLRLARFVRLPLEVRDLPSNRGQMTYMAFSKASMDLLQTLTLRNVGEHDLYRSGAFTSALEALALPIHAKYIFHGVTKGSPLWKSATSVSLEILNAALPEIKERSVETRELQRIWKRVVSITNGIISAKGSTEDLNFNIVADESFDITSFNSIRNLITPALGGSVVLDQTRRTYTECLFHNSIIHKPEMGELPESGSEVLQDLYKARMGRTYDPPPSPRSKMSYRCLDELFQLVQKQDGSADRVRLAQAASPFVILRAGLSLRAYIADQPLRGRMPQPLTQRREFLYILEKLVDLECEPRSIPDAPGVVSESKKHLHRLFPLVSKAARVAWGDQQVLEMLGRMLDGVGREMGVS